jgi:hypothetical protein
MEMKQEEITPQRAADLLAKQVPNRRIRATKVDEWAADMSAGRWRPIMQPIMVNLDGLLIDGQHRLSAVIKSGVTVSMWVAYGVPDEHRRYIDSPTARTAADVLGMEYGARNQTQIQAMATTVLRYEQYPDTPWTRHNDIGKQRIIDEYNADPESYADAVNVAQRGTKHCGTGLWLTRGSYGSLHVLVHRYSPTADLWEQWNLGVETGADLKYGDPRLTLRNSKRNSQSGGRGQYNLLACIKAWNAFVRGDDLKQLKVGSPKYLPMPKIA